MSRTDRKSGVSDEFSRLRACIVHRPGAEFDRLLPRHIEAAIDDGAGGLARNPDYLLFDDLVLTGALQSEHRDLCAVIQAAVGDGNLYDLRDLLQRILWQPAFRRRVIDAVLALESDIFGGVPADAATVLEQLPPAQLGEALVSGVVTGEGRQLLHWPMPNWLFARDCFALAGDAIVLGYPRHKARWRDGLLARAIVRHHPLFHGADLVDLEAPAGCPPQYFEGGDLLLPSKDVALIGIGLRTNLAAARTLAGELQRRGRTNVLGVKLPMRRGAMHLDTIFTMLDERTCVYFAPAFSPNSEVGECVEVVDLLDKDRPLGVDLLGCLRDVGVDVTAIPCGDNDPVAARREQWTDGANAVCLGPGRVLLYARNVATLRALNRAGFRVLQPAEFVRNVDLLMQDDHRFVVAVSGFELSRGRGGPRCLTLPIARG